jgi:hypothetical protein
MKMSDTEMHAMYQLLKKDSSGNHNKLKAEACKACFNTGKRGKPLGIVFYYQGDENWAKGCPRTGRGAIRGCLGCGWYDFNEWRKALNALIQETN